MWEVAVKHKSNRVLKGKAGELDAKSQLCRKLFKPTIGSTWSKASIYRRNNTGSDDYPVSIPNVFAARPTFNAQTLFRVTSTCSRVADYKTGSNPQLLMPSKASLHCLPVGNGMARSWISFDSLTVNKHNNTAKSNFQQSIIHAKNVWCCGEGYFGQKKIAEKVQKSRQNVNRDKSA